MYAILPLSPPRDVVLARARARDPEVDELDRTVVAHEHVRRRHVAVDDVQRHAIRTDLVVRVVQARAQPRDERERGIERQRHALLQRLARDLSEILAVDVLHREEVVAIFDADVVDLRDVGMMQGRGETRLVEEHLDERRVARQLRQDPLDHPELLEALESHRAREVELGHATDRDLANQVILAELVARSQMTGLLWRTLHHLVEKDRRRRRGLQYNPSVAARILIAGAIAASVAACSPFGGGGFSCERDDQCGAGTCSNGYCSFVDPSCDSGYRYGDLSGSLANTCVSAGATGDANGDDAQTFLDARVAMDGGSCYGTGFGRTCLTTPPGTPATLTAQRVDTDTSPLCATDVVGNPPWCVIAATDLTIGAGTLSAIGSKPLVLVATGSLLVDGTIDIASHRGGQTGAGAVPATNTTLCDPGTPPGNNGGGAGGSFGTKGGKGGNAGGTAGAIQPATALRGGCAGQDGKSGTPGLEGLGGGAIYLIAGTTITVGGAINASGAGGTAGVNGDAGGGGGGAGGLIGLDAPMVTNGGAIFANGGGGAEGSGNQTKGNDGNESQNGVAAAQTTSASNGGEGGAGGAVTAAGDGASANGSGGGGGGGGAGAIRLFQATAITGGVVSPPPS